MSWLLATTPEERPYTDSAKTDTDRLKNLFRAHGWIDPEPIREKHFQENILKLAEEFSGEPTDKGAFSFYSQSHFMAFVNHITGRKLTELGSDGLPLNSGA